MLTSSDAAHLLRRVGFGGTAQEITHFTGMRREDAVDEILATASPIPALPGYVSIHDWWERIQDLRWWWLERMADARWVERDSGTPNPLVEKLTLFWHSHFATGVHKVGDLGAVAAQIQLFRRYGLGDFETLLAKVTFDDPAAGALLTYLDNDTNEKANPQENFARELMELYTIGPDEFTEPDVVAMTRAWTGHGTVGWVGYHDATYEYHSEYHDDGTKTLFGLSRNWEPVSVVRELTRGVKNEACARFLVRKFWRFFVSATPPASAVNELVATFAPSMNVSVLLRAMLRRDEFWAADTRYGIVRSPVECAVDLLRRLGLRMDEANYWFFSSGEQSLFAPPNVAGWGTHSYWLSTQGAWGRSDLLTNLRWRQSVYSQFESWFPNDRSTWASPQAGAAMIIEKFGLTDVSAETRSALEGWWAAHQRADGWAAKHNVLFVGVLNPEFQTA